MNKSDALVVSCDLLKTLWNRTKTNALRIAYRFKITLDIAQLSTPTTAFVFLRNINHILPQTLLIKQAPADNLKADDFGALLEDRRWGRGHGSGKYPTDICMVGPWRCKEDNLGRIGGVENSWRSIRVLTRFTYDPPARGELTMKTSPSLISPSCNFFWNLTALVQWSETRTDGGSMAPTSSWHPDG